MVGTMDLHMAVRDNSISKLTLANKGTLVEVTVVRAGSVKENMTLLGDKKEEVLAAVRCFLDGHAIGSYISRGMDGKVRTPVKEIF